MNLFGLSQDDGVGRTEATDQPTAEKYDGRRWRKHGSQFQIVVWIAEQNYIYSSTEKHKFIKTNDLFVDPGA